MSNLPPFVWDNASWFLQFSNKLEKERAELKNKQVQKRSSKNSLSGMNILSALSGKG